MKKILTLFLIMNATLIHCAAGTTEGPLQVGNFDTYVAQTVTNKIVRWFLPKATKRNGGTLPSGSVTATWDAVAKAGVTSYFETHHDQMEASALYINKANENSMATKWYKHASNSDAPFEQRVCEWNIYNMTISAVYGLLEKESIPTLNVLPLSVVGIMEKNQDVIFTPEEQASFGGAIAASISIMNLIYKKDTAAFKAMFKKYLPEASVTD